MYYIYIYILYLLYIYILHILYNIFIYNTYVIYIYIYIHIYNIYIYIYIYIYIIPPGGLRVPRWYHAILYRFLLCRYIQNALPSPGYPWVILKAPGPSPQPPAWGVSRADNAILDCFLICKKEKNKKLESKLTS